MGLVILQEIVRTITFGQFLQYFFYILLGLVSIWGVFKGFSTKANKEDLDKLSEKVELKLDKTEFESHRELYEEYKARHEKAHLDVSRQTYDKIDKLQSSFDTFALKVIEILADKDKTRIDSKEKKDGNNKSIDNQ